MGYALMECEEKNKLPDGRVLYSDIEDKQVLFISPENVYDTPVQVLGAVIKLLEKTGYELRCEPPSKARKTTRLIIIPPDPKPEPSAMEKWADERPLIENYKTQLDFMSAVTAWVNKMPVDVLQETAAG